MEYSVGSGTKKILQFIMEDWKLLLILTLIFAIYFYYTSTFDYFEKRGIPYMKPTIFLGNFGPRVMAKTSNHEFQIDIYNYFKGQPYAGVFEGRKPVLYVFDPDLIKAVLIADHENFVDRNSLSGKEPRYLGRSLLNLKGAEWKAVRSRLTPAHSSARLRHMLPLVQLCTQQLVDFLQQYDGCDVEMKKAIGHFTLEVIGACAFGVRCDALADENAHFFKVAEKFNYISKAKRMLIFSLLVFAPKLIELLNVSFLNRASTDELMRMLKAAAEERRQSGVKRNDFLQLMLDAAEKERQEAQNGKTEINLDDDTIYAQSVLFLIAGFETSSTLLSFALHVLAAQPGLQARLRDHVTQATRGKEMTYELLAEMTYLEAFLMETLRMYPPVPFVDRVAVRDCALAGLALRKGDVLKVSVSGVHYEPRWYPAPAEFRPERFLGEERRERPPHAFLAFGAGPRNCIGLRFAMFSAKLAMVALITNFEISACDKTDIPVRLNKRTALLQADGGVWVRLRKLPA